MNIRPLCPSCPLPLCIVLSLEISNGIANMIPQTARQRAVLLSPVCTLHVIDCKRCGWVWVLGHEVYTFCAHSLSLSLPCARSQCMLSLSHGGLLRVLNACSLPHTRTDLHGRKSKCAQSMLPRWAMWRKMPPSSS